MKSLRDVIYALDCCSHDKPCGDCPYGNPRTPGCYDLLMEDALELLKRCCATCGHWGGESGDGQMWFCSGNRYPHHSEDYCSKWKPLGEEALAKGEE